MVGSPDKPVEEEELAVESIVQDPKVQTFKDTVEFPSLDSYLDYDSCNWLGNNSRTEEEFRIDDKDFDFFENEMEVGQEGVSASEEASLENQNAVMFGSTEERSELCGESSENVGMITSESMIEVKPELCGGMTEDIGASLIKSDSMIEADRNLSDELSANLDGVAEPAVKESEPDGSDNSRPMEYGAASVACLTMNLGDLGLENTDVGLASSIEVRLGKVSLTMGDDEKTDGAKGKSINIAESESETSSSSSSTGDSSSSSQELEEGEIRSVDEEHEVEEDEEPVRSKNELKELPLVPAVDVTLEPHHITLPVGAVLSVVSTQVVVEGIENHSPLAEGSMLWLTERRTPLGLVDEIFGPVKRPYYTVTFNSESEVPEGVSQGTPVSFVADFAQHLNIEELRTKGYDASGVNDEEISDELEFSDDEKEAEYRRMQRMGKRVMMDDKETCNTRNKKNKNRDPRRPTSSYSDRSDPHMCGPVSNLQPRPQMDPNRGVWRPQSNQQNPYLRPPMPNQMVMPNLLPMQIPLFQPQFNAVPMSIPPRQGGLNFFQGQASASWPGLVGQNLFNQQPFRMGRGFHMHHPQLPMNPRYNMLNPRPQSSMNPQFLIQPETRPQFQVPQPPVQPQSQGFSTGQSSERGRGHRGRGRGRGRGRF